MEDLAEVVKVELKNSLVNSVAYLPLYERVTAIAQFGVADKDDAQLLIAALKDRHF